MKKVMITSAAVALAFGLSPFASAQPVDDGSAVANDHSKAVAKTKINDSYNDYTKTVTKNDNDTKTVTKTYTDNSDNSKTITKNDNDQYTKTFTKNDNDTKTVTKTYTDSNNDTKIKDSYNEKTKWDGKAKNDYSPFGAAANNHSTAYTNLEMKDSFNQTKIVNTTKLDGYVSHNKVAHVGNYGGDAYAYNPGGRGGDGYAKAKAYSGDAHGGDGGDAKAKAYGGDAYGGDAKARAKGGYAEGGDAKFKGDDGGYADGGDAKAKAKGGYAEGGDAKAKANGGDGGYAESGYADAHASGNGGNGARGGDTYGGDAGTFNASNSISGLTGAAGVTVAIQNTGIAALQQVGVTTMAHINVN